MILSGEIEQDRKIYGKPTKNEIVGIDVGKKTYCTNNDGSKNRRPQSIRKILKQIKKLSRRLSRIIDPCWSTKIIENELNNKGLPKKKRIFNKAFFNKKIKNDPKYLDTVKRLQSLHRRVRNQRENFQHHLSNKYLKEYRTIVVEGLNIKNIIDSTKKSKKKSKKAENRNNYDAAWSKFFWKLQYKTERSKDRLLIKIDPKNTSKTCSNCGFVKEDLTLKDRAWICPHCGERHDRDINAAINICHRGLSKINKEEYKIIHKNKKKIFKKHALRSSTRS